jgi:ABC-2 type transport system ATP-binding protein
LCDRVAIIDHGRIVDVDTPAGLIDRHCPERTVVLTTDDPVADAHFASIPGVESVARAPSPGASAGQASQVTIRGTGHDLISAVIRCLSEHRIHVIDFRTEHPGLEDVFLKLTGHSVRS